MHSSRRADQGAVWEAIDDTMTAMSARSHTEAMGAIYEQHRASLEKYVAAFRHRPGQVGAVFLLGARVAGLDLVAEREKLIISAQVSTGLIDDVRVAVIPARRHGAIVGGCAPAG